MSNKQPHYTGRSLILQALDPLRRAHLEGKIEGLEKAMRLVREKPDYSGNLLATVIQDAISATRMTIIEEAKVSDSKGKPRMTEEQYTKYKSWLTLMRDQALTGSSRMAYEDALSVLVGIKHNWPSVAFLPQSK